MWTLLVKYSCSCSPYCHSLSFYSPFTYTSIFLLCVRTRMTSDKVAELCCAELCCAELCCAELTCKLSTEKVSLDVYIKNYVEPLCIQVSWFKLSDKISGLIRWIKPYELRAKQIQNFKKFRGLNITIICSMKWYAYAKKINEMWEL